MEKLKMHTQDKTQENIAQIAALFPNAVTETIKDGKVIQAIDFDVLRQELSDVVVEGPVERYQFTWPDKRKSILMANAPIAKTLRPCREESVDFDTTENLYIEGDNLDALKLLQETYLGKVKMIYIDPPYNTGNDFVYEDNFSESPEEYLPGSGQFDEEGGRLVLNPESNGRHHTDWLNMMFPRIKQAKDLLSDDGIVFISIDDNEVENLKKLLNEIFGEENLLLTFCWRRTDNQSNIGNFARVKEYIVTYAKNKNKVVFEKMELSETAKNEYRYEDSKGSFRRQNLIDNTRGRIYYKVTTPTGRIIEGPWMVEKDEFDKLLENEAVYWANGDTPYGKLYLQDSKGQITSDWLDKEFGTNQRGSGEIAELFNKRVFDFPKPTKLIRHLINISNLNNEIVIDFFAGSCTTAHAVMQLNAEDGGKRKFIMVQLPEETGEKSEAYKAGYKNICEIGKERIRRAGQKIRQESGLLGQDLDIGFRVLKVDSTNMEDVYYSPSEYKQSNLLALAENIKSDRTTEDLLFQIMLDLGILLSSPIKETSIEGKKVYDVANGYLLASFDSELNEKVITEIARKKPYYAIFRDSSIANDSVAANFEQIFATYSPTTVRKVL